MGLKHDRETPARGSRNKQVQLARHLLALSMLVLIGVSSCSPWDLLPRPPEEVLHPRPKQERMVVSNTLPLQLKWKYKLDLLLGSPLSVQDGQIIVWQANILSALDAETGREEWNLHRQDDFDFVTAVGQNSIACSDPMLPHGEMSVLSGATGQLKWKNQIDIVYSFAIGDGRLYAGWFGHATAYNLEDGTLKWDMTEGLPIHTGITVYYDAGKVYVITYNHLFVLNAQDGRVLRSFDYSTTRLEVVSDETVFGVSSANVIATDAQSGATRWIKQVTPLDGYLPPTLLQGTLYVLTWGGELMALDANTGELEWVAEDVQQAFSNVVEFNGIGYVLSKDGRLYGFDVATGRQIGVLTTSPDIAARIGGAPAIPSLAVVGNTLAVTFGDSYVYGFAGSTP